MFNTNHDGILPPAVQDYDKTICQIRLCFITTIPELHRLTWDVPETSS